MAQRILSIDLGSWSVKAVLIETGFRGFRVERAIECPLHNVAAALPPDKNNQPEDASQPPPPAGFISIEEKEEQQRLALEALLADESLRADAYIAAFPGDETAFRFVHLPFSDTRKVGQVIEGELEDLVPFDLYEGVFDYEVLERNPVRGSSGNSLSLAAVAKKNAIRRYIERLNEANFDPKFLPIDVLELYNLYTHFLANDGTRPQTPDSSVTLDSSATLDSSVSPASSSGVGELVEEDTSPKPQGRLIADIGHTRTLVLVASEKGIAYARVIRMGGADITRAIAKAYGLNWAQAEEGKHAEGFVATRQHPAADDAEQQLSDIITRGLTPLVRELRRTIATIRRERRVDINRVDLLGGGANLRNLPQFLAEAFSTSVALGAAVEQNVDHEIPSERRGAFAGALASALRVSGEAPVNSLDFRRGELAFSGGLQHLKNRLPALLSAVAVLTLLLGMYAVLRMSAVGTREKEVDLEFCSVTKEVIGREICEPDVAESVIRNPPSDLGSFILPSFSGFDILLEISAQAPASISVKVTDINITSERAIVEGEAPSFDSVDSLVAAYGESKCLKDIQKDRLRKKTGAPGVEFQLKMKVECS